MSKREMAFKDVPMSAENRRLIVDTLKEEGFSEEQLNGMLGEQVWKLYIDSVRELLSREMASFYSTLEKNPHIASAMSPLVSQLVEKLRKTVEDLERKEKESHEGKGSE